ncbi:MAG: YcxB family protein [Firmicutes bacterium]|nr:YcxB family protein [Bacillota bacterium]
MKPLYMAQTETDFEEYKLLCRTLRRQRKRFWYIVIMTGVLLVALAAIYWAEKNLTGGIILTACAALYPVLFVLFDHISLKRSYQQNSALHGLVTTLSFYEDHMESKSRLGHSSLAYNKLFRIVETDTHFYLMPAYNQAYMVKKANCGEGLTDFLREVSKTIPLPKRQVFRRHRRF